MEQLREARRFVERLRARHGAIQIDFHVREVKGWFRPLPGDENYVEIEDQPEFSDDGIAELLHQERTRADVAEAFGELDLTTWRPLGQSERRTHLETPDRRAAAELLARCYTIVTTAMLPPREMAELDRALESLGTFFERSDPHVHGRASR